MPLNKLRTKVQLGKIMSLLQRVFPTSRFTAFGHKMSWRVTYMSIILITKSEKARLKFVSGENISFVFVCTASCNVYYNFQDCIYIALFCMLYVIGYFIPSQN